MLETSIPLLIYLAKLLQCDICSNAYFSTSSAIFPLHLPMRSPRCVVATILATTPTALFPVSLRQGTCVCLCVYR